MHNKLFDLRNTVTSIVDKGKKLTIWCDWFTSKHITCTCEAFPCIFSLNFNFCNWRWGKRFIFYIVRHTFFAIIPTTYFEESNQILVELDIAPPTVCRRVFTRLTHTTSLWFYQHGVAIRVFFRPSTFNNGFLPLLSLVTLRAAWYARSRCMLTRHKDTSCKQHNQYQVHTCIRSEKK